MALSLQTLLTFPILCLTFAGSEGLLDSTLAFRRLTADRIKTSKRLPTAALETQTLTSLY